MSIERNERQFKSNVDILIETLALAGLATEQTDEEAAQSAEHHRQSMEPKHPTARYKAGQSELDLKKIPRLIQKF